MLLEHKYFLVRSNNVPLHPASFHRLGCRPNRVKSEQPNICLDLPIDQQIEYYIPQSQRPKVSNYVDPSVISDHLHSTE